MPSALAAIKLVNYALLQQDWLPVRQRVRFKLASIMYKSLSGQAPQYLAGDVQLLADSLRHLLRSVNYRTCVIPRTQNSFGDRDFSVAGRRIWNDLNCDVRLSALDNQKHAGFSQPWRIMTF